jgi:4-amino-4-deoxy-L-arabinose transferase-like glycosyltransferase/SAM-dependent methyltransferase
MALQAHLDAIRAHFDMVAPIYPALKARNRYYHEFLARWCRAMLPPGRKVLDVGCGRGELLAAVEPSHGVGVDLSSAMVARARDDNPSLQFSAQAMEAFEGDGSFDAALCINTLEYMWDVGTVLARVRAALRDNGRLLITTANPVWSPVFKLASRLGLRTPDGPRLFITNLDLVNLLELHGFEVVYERMHLAIPKRIPGISEPVNFLVSRIPGLRLISSMQMVVARKLPSAPRGYSVSMIIPCHNERDNVDRCVRAIPKLGTSTEAIFVDDGSTDGTAERVRPELNPGVDVRVISYPTNRGKGHAVKTGFDAARGDIVMIVDADLTTDPAEFQPLYDAFATGRAEFVNGTRFVYPMAGRAMKWANYMGNRVFTILVSLIMERRVSDTLCGTKAMFRWDYRHMTMGRDPWGDYDLLFGAAQLRLALREIPVHYQERTGGESKMRPFAHMMNLLRMCWMGFWQVKTLPPLSAARAADARRSARSAQAAWGIFAVAAAIRLATAVAKGTLGHPELFEYDGMARNLLAGRGLTFTHLGIVYHSFAPPLHAWLSAASYWLTGSIVPLMLLQIAAGSAIAVTAAAIAERLFDDRRAGIAAGLLVAVHPGLIFYSATKAHPLSFDALFFALALWTFVRLHAATTVMRGIALGAIVGLGTLSRSTMLIFFPLGALWLLAVTPRSTRRAAAGALAVAVTVAVLVVLPWSIRDSLVHHRGLFLISTTGEDFWDGNNPLATGHSYIDGRLALIDALPPDERADLESQPDEIAQSEWFMKKATAFIKANPERAARLTALKFFHFWWFAPQTGILYPAAWRSLYMTYYAAALLLAAAGVRRITQLGPEAVRLGLLVGLFCLGLSVVQSVYYVEARHRWAIEPLLLAVSGGGAASIGRKRLDVAAPS